MGIFKVKPITVLTGGPTLPIRASRGRSTTVIILPKAPLPDAAIAMAVRGGGNRGHVSVYPGYASETIVFAWRQPDHIHLDEIIHFYTENLLPIVGREPVQNQYAPEIEPGRIPDTYGELRMSQCHFENLPMLYIEIF